MTDRLSPAVVHRRVIQLEQPSCRHSCYSASNHLFLRQSIGHQDRPLPPHHRRSHSLGPRVRRTRLTGCNRSSAWRATRGRHESNLLWDESSIDTHDTNQNGLRAIYGVLEELHGPPFSYGQVCHVATHRPKKVVCTEKSVWAIRANSNYAVTDLNIF